MRKGFTLLEVLLALTLMGVFFSTLSYVFYNTIKNSYSLSEASEVTKEEINLFWDLQRKLMGAKDIYLKKSMLFMITSSGNYYQGVVKCGYVYKDGWLYYYEFPYPYGDMAFYEEDKLMKIGKFKELYFRAFAGDYQEEFRGLPQWIEVYLEGIILRIGI
ncbi:MAG: prepilin-type N-terminal cleavage/methylation domain-containing protein [Aquificaceae bacterium]